MTKMTMKMNCPICEYHYYSISQSLDICEKHEDWLITQCSACGRMCFSEEIRLCLKCSKKSVSNYNHVEEE